MFNTSNSKNITFMIVLLAVATITIGYVWVSGAFNSPIYADITNSSN